MFAKLLFPTTIRQQAQMSCALRRARKTASGRIRAVEREPSVILTTTP